MFINQSGKEQLAGRTYELETEGGIRLLLFAGEEGEADRENGIESALELRLEEETAAVFLHGEKKPETPLFGPQTYLDAEKGLSYFLEIAGAEKFLAIYQHKSWWIRPSFPADAGAVPEKTQLLLLRAGEEYVAVLAVCGEEYRTDLAGSGSRLRVTAASNCIGKNRADDLSLVLAVGKDPYLCCEQAVKRALSLTGREKLLRRERTYPEMFEYFGWCSWDAFYHQVSEAGIVEKLTELREKRIPARWVLIDDGWLDADYERQVLKGLDAAPEKFPDGLSGCVDKIKRNFGIDRVGVWHAVMGYWNGLEEGSEADSSLRSGSRRLRDGRVIPDADAGRAFLFYDGWHDYLSSRCGVDFVKVDGQSAIALFYQGEKEYGLASEAVMKGLNASAALHFEGRMINCMGMASQEMWHRPGSAVSRSSDDFVPDVPHGFREHAVQNGFNSLLQGQFFWGDWDMFWSDHEESRQNSILRAVSGGPVYTSDPVGRTDRRYLDPLMRRDGRLIRCEEVGMPTADCLFDDPVETGRVLKLFNRYRDAFAVAAFHLGREEKAEEGWLRLTDIPGLAGKEWIVYRFREKTVARLSAQRDYSFRLKPCDGELFLLFPASGFLVLGILEKYIGQGCVEAVRRNGERTEVLLSEGGTFGFISDRRPGAVVCGGEKLPLTVCSDDGAGAFFYTAAVGQGLAGESGCRIDIVW